MTQRQERVAVFAFIGIGVLVGTVFIGLLAGWVVEDERPAAAAFLGAVVLIFSTGVARWFSRGEPRQWRKPPRDDDRG